MTLPELHPELWIHIFKFVKRDVSPPWKYANWSDLHQEDLATVCRVSLRFHSLAAPILYRTMVLPNLPILLEKLRAFGSLPERPHSLSTAPLEVLLSRTQTLRIAGLPPPCKPKLRLEHLLQHGSHLWSVIGATPEEELEEAGYAAGTELQATSALFYGVRNSKLVSTPVFTSVRRIILGQRSHWHWTELGPSQPASQELIHSQLGIDRFLLAHSPKSLCTHSNLGPYCLYYAYGDDTQLAQMHPTVTRHAYAQYEEATIIPGAKNRWTFYPGCLTSYPGSNIQGEPSPPGYDAFQDQYTSIASVLQSRHSKWESTLESGERTSLETYGHAAWGPSLRDRVLQAVHGSVKGGEVHHAARLDQPRVYEEMLATYRDKSKKLQAAEGVINAKLVDSLREYGHLPQGEGCAKPVQLLPWRDTPPCDCCGWEMGDYMEEVTAGLNPREAVLVRALHSLKSDAGKESDA